MCKQQALYLFVYFSEPEGLQKGGIKLINEIYELQYNNYDHLYCKRIFKGLKNNRY